MGPGILINIHLPQVLQRRKQVQRKCVESLGIRWVILDIIITTTHV